MSAKRAILLIDHGSRRREANETLRCMADLVRYMLGEAVVVSHAHMELVAPTVAEGFDVCVAKGALEVLVQPYLLAPGRHAATDIPRLVAEAAVRHPGVAYRVCEPLGVHAKLAELVIERCGLAPAREVDGAGAAGCTLERTSCPAPWCARS